MSAGTDIQTILKDAKTIVIIQADNPDGDSLASSLALEQILHDMGKEPHMFCGIDMPAHLKYLSGWDRVVKDIPHQFDASIIVDCSTRTLLETADKTGQLAWIAAKPCIVIDHHSTEATIDFAKVLINQSQAVSTGEIIYELAKELDWKLDLHAMTMIAVSILSDSLGLMSEGTSARSIHIIAELVEGGVNLAGLETKRRELMRKSVELTRYKGLLLQRVEYFSDDRVATITIPWDEIEKYSNAYNPSMLVLDDMRMTENTDVAIAFKEYKDRRVTGKIRANYGVNIANKIAEHFGGGGHPYAAGFKVLDGRPLHEIKSECIKVATELLDNLKQETPDEIA
jgi:bifunctional oligoribonuclease and PAP phosphatase NrnA